MTKKRVQKIWQASGRRLDDASSILFKITKSRAQKLIKTGQILLNGKKTVPKAVVNTGDRLDMISQQKTKIDIPVIFEDDTILVIDKPAGITIHPAPGEKDPTITEIIGKVYPVHRLDKGTTGVLVLAKDSLTRLKLQDQFRQRKVEKVYLAVLEGELKPESGLIDIPLAREETVREKIGPKRGGRHAQTEYQVKSYLKGYSLVEAKPKTGRTHQVRVHFSVLGHPVAGDRRYGAKKAKIPILLHASAISFFHPKTGRRVTYKASPPINFEQMIGKLK